MAKIITQEFRALSAKLGQDPLQVQGAGGNTSIKADGRMWIKASGTELADALEREIFVEVNRDAAKDEIFSGGDGSCKQTIIDKTIELRPSIETTFHAFLDWPIVAHTHSVAAITHVISKQGIAVAKAKLRDLSPVFVPYKKPGLPLTKKIIELVSRDTNVILLQNHGLICAGNSVAEVEQLLADIEARLRLDPVSLPSAAAAPNTEDEQYEFVGALSGLARDDRLFRLATGGSYYPDHVVFLGHALPTSEAGGPVAYIKKDKGVFIRRDATKSQRAMLRCFFDILTRLPSDWDVCPIGPEAEAELLNWDAEKYRQDLSKQDLSKKG